MASGYPSMRIGDGDGDSGGAHFVFAYYTTGHPRRATRGLQVVKLLLSAGHEVHVVTASPEFESTITTQIDTPGLHTRNVDQVVLDCVALEPDALTAHLSGSKAVVPRAPIVKREAEWLELISADFVILNPWILDDVSDAANMNRRSLLSDWEGLRGREQTPSPRPPSKRSRCNSLPPSTTPRKGDHQSRSSSSPPSPDRTKGHLIPMAVFWDIENCRVPVHAEDISKNIRTALQMNHDVDSAAAVIGAYGAVDAKTRKLLERNGINHFSISKKEKKKDAADKMIWADMFQFASNHPAPAYILLITGDADFAPTARFLVQCGYTIVIALPEEGKTASELFTAGNYAWDWTSLAMGKGIVTRSLQADLDSLKTEMIQLYTSKGGYIDSGHIHSEYTKKFRKQIKLSYYKAEKMVDLFKMMGDPFIISGEKMVFLDSQSSQSTTSVTAFQAHPPASVAEDSSIDTERKKDPCFPNEDVNCEAMIECATPSVRSSRWDEMPDADVTPEAAGASLGVTPSGTWDAIAHAPCSACLVGC